MKWGEYLCYGVQQHRMHQQDLQTTEEEEMNRAQKVLSKLEETFHNMGLTPFSTKIIIQFITSKLQAGQGEKISRVMAYLLQLLHPAQANAAREGSRQKGCPQLIPGLRAKPIWKVDDFPWINEFQKQFAAIRHEFLNLKGYVNNGFQHYKSPNQANATDKGEWNVCYLLLHDIEFKENHEKCPVTLSTIKNIPRQYNHAFFSAIAPNTHIMPHYGPTNKKLRCFLPLFVPDTPHSSSESSSSSCWLEVDGQRIHLSNGECFVFDDSFYHEAANEHPTQPRIVLIVDVWHPDLTNEEIKILEFLNKAQINAMKRLQKQHDEQKKSASSITEEEDLLAHQQYSQQMDTAAGAAEDIVEETFYSAILASNAQGIHSAADIEKIWGNYT